MRIQCLLGKHEWREDGIKADHTVYAYCKYCDERITIEKRICEREKNAYATNGEPYWENNMYFVPTFRLKRVYSGETVCNDYECAKNIQSNNTLNGLIKEYIRGNRERTRPRHKR